MASSPSMRVIVATIAVLGAVSGATWLTQAQAQQPKPNVVFIMTDDVGYGDLGEYGSPDIRTPNIDQLATDGVRFTDFYANAPSCSPTRAGFITGRYQQRVGIEAPLPGPAGAGDRGLRATGRTLPRLLKNNGYATALIGKWHLGYGPERSPAAHGFDYFFGFKSGFIDYYQHTGGDGRPDLFENETPVVVDGYMTDLITERAVTYIRQNAQRPFFLSVQYNAAHWPYQVPDMPSVARNNAAHLQPQTENTSTRADFRAILERADRGIGEIVKAIAAAGIADNTLVIFTNDNGGEWLARNAPLFNRKLTVWEGGIRVAAIMRWPGRIPAGRVTDQVGITMDFTSTILAATHSPVPADADLEGIDLLPIVEGRSPEVDRTLFWRSADGRDRAVRSGDWKMLVAGGATFVFNVRADLGERNDLANRRQDVAHRLRPQLDAWEADVNAEAEAAGVRQPAPARGQGAGGRGRGAAPAGRQ